MDNCYTLEVQGDEILTLIADIPFEGNGLFESEGLPGTRATWSDPSHTQSTAKELKAKDLRSLVQTDFKQATRSRKKPLNFADADDTDLLTKKEEDWTPLLIDFIPNQVTKPRGAVEHDLYALIYKVANNQITPEDLERLEQRLRETVRDEVGQVRGTVRDDLEQLHETLNARLGPKDLLQQPSASLVGVRFDEPASLDAYSEYLGRKDIDHELVDNLGLIVARSDYDTVGVPTSETYRALPVRHGRPPGDGKFRALWQNNPKK